MQNSSENNNSRTIAIVGCGFCGMMAAVNIMQGNSLRAIKLVVINADNDFGKGVAFSATSLKYLLNVPAGNMSCFENDPDHFINWLHKKKPYSLISEIMLSKVFAPRQEYGNYLRDVWQEALQKKNENISVELINDFAEDISINEKGKLAIISFRKNESIFADQVILATGNEKPSNISIINQSFYKSNLYFENPWLPEAVKNSDIEKNIFIIGNSLTMVDTVIGLIENKFQGKIYSISPNGFALLPHGYSGKIYEGLLNELAGTENLNMLLHLFKKHIKLVTKFGFNAEPVIDSVRTNTQKMWRALTIADKKQFLNPFSRKWNTGRHRIPSHIHRLMQDLRIQGRLLPLTGHIIDITETEKEATIKFYDKKTKKEESINAMRVINCTGPSTDITRSENPLIQNLVKKNLIHADELHLGINATSDGAIINANGKISSVLFTLGSSLKGILWEITAVPDLRIQCENLAKLLA
jgi:uncharacterized NAD(P)/FAD-binding protein YdhS